MEIANKFQIDEAIEYPSADISFQWASNKDAELKIHMHFSRVVDGPSNDLELLFYRPIAVQWEEESFGLIKTPSVTPKCSNGRFELWSYPLLTIEPSQWANLYAANMYSEEDFKKHHVVHYLFVSMNDLVHVLSEEPPIAKWVVSADA